MYNVGAFAKFNTLLFMGLNTTCERSISVYFSIYTLVFS